MIYGLRAVWNEECLVDQGRGDSAEDGTDPVTRLALEDATRHRRPEGSRWIHRRTGEWSDGEYVRGDGETDREAADLGRARIDRRPEDHEHEKEGGDELEHDGLQCRHLDGNRLTAQPRADHYGGREEPAQRISGEHRGEDLRDDVDHRH